VRAVLVEHCLRQHHRRVDLSNEWSAWRLK